MTPSSTHTLTILTYTAKIEKWRKNSDSLNTKSERDITGYCYMVNNALSIFFGVKWAPDCLDWF